MLIEIFLASALKHVFFQLLFPSSALPRQSVRATANKTQVLRRESSHRIYGVGV